MNDVNELFANLHTTIICAVQTKLNRALSAAEMDGIYRIHSFIQLEVIDQAVVMGSVEDVENIIQHYAKTL